MDACKTAIIIHTLINNPLTKCAGCYRYRAKALQAPPEPPLPPERVMATPTFMHCGVDYFGPMYIRQNEVSQKVLGCLFACLAIRAIHIEIVLDCSTQKFLMAFQRFISRRGAPATMLSDQRTQFKSAAGAIDRIWHAPSAQTMCKTSQLINPSHGSSQHQPHLGAAECTGG